MTDLGYEKAIRSGNMYGDEYLLSAVTTWRTPDVVFDWFAEIDLGGRVVQLWHFGPGNGPGDTVVHVPDTGTAWTGNYVSHVGVAPMLLQGGPEPYLSSLEKMRDALPRLGTIVPGHGPVGDGRPAIDWLIQYLERLRDEVNSAFGAGKTLDETTAAVSDPWAAGLDPILARSMAAYAPTAPHAADEMLAPCRNLHRLNVLATYRLHETAA